MTVGIKKVQLSDSGQYQCKLERNFWTDGWGFTGSTAEVKIQVYKAAPLVKSPALRVITPITAVRPTLSPGPDPHFGLSTITQQQQQQSDASNSFKEDSVLFISLVLTGALVLVVAALLLVFYCRKRVHRPQDAVVNKGVQQTVAAEDSVYQNMDYADEVYQNVDL
ncbi:hypothetical protein WMY93_027717 [Mugilogobius chulae]|uniref:Uncharacterized protein n=1 Tax=Mugilogobius chulae TaxID=88201 RepID=A0AAW0N0I3_9GOBI